MKSRGYLSLLAWGPPQGTISLDHMVWVICNSHNWDFQSPSFSIPSTDYSPACYVPIFPKKWNSLTVQSAIWAIRNA